MKWIILISLLLLSLGGLAAAWPGPSPSAAEARPDSRAIGAVWGQWEQHAPGNESGARRPWGTPHPALLAALQVMISVAALIGADLCRAADGKRSPGAA